MFKNLLKTIRVVSLLMVAAVVINACNDDDEKKSGVVVESFGPSPALRGGELKFIGQNLNRVSAIQLPGGVEVKTFKTQEPNLIVIDVPIETALRGKVTMVTPDGNITTKTELGISEPITVINISPSPIRPGEVLTITGTYLNLIEEIVFASKKSTDEFESQSKEKIEVIVPADAMTGKLILSNGAEEPILIESPELIVALPAATALSPATVKAGAELTITGINLDLVQDITFVGNSRLSTFVSQSATEIVIEVPEDAQDGAITMRPASLVEVSSATSIAMLLPTISEVTPDPAKNNGTVTVTGTDLDLISNVEFGGGKAGSIESGGSATSIVVKVPADAVDGVVKFTTKAQKSVNSPDALALVKPTITSISPTSVNTIDNPSVTINGTNLDLVNKVIFGGGWAAEVKPASSTSFTVNVVPGSVTGKITLVTTNATEVVSGSTLTIVPNIPNIATMPASATIGQYLTITGTNLNVPSQVILPGNIVATQFGSKTSTVLEIFIPSTVTPGSGSIQFVTNKNEIYNSPQTNFKFAGVEPIVDPALVIYDFTPGTDGHGLGWDNWGGALEILNSNPGPGIESNGNFIHGTKTLNSWTWLWGCNHSQLVKPSVTKADHVFKFDVYLTTAPPAGGSFLFRFAGTEVNLGNLGAKTTASWVTVTFDLSSFGSLPGSIPGDGEWGLIYNGPSYDMTGFYADNFRYEAK